MSPYIIKKCKRYLKDNDEHIPKTYSKEIQSRLNQKGIEATSQQIIDTRTCKRINVTIFNELKSYIEEYKDLANKFDF